MIHGYVRFLWVLRTFEDCTHIYMHPYMIDYDYGSGAIDRLENHNTKTQIDRIHLVHTVSLAAGISYITVKSH